MALTKVVNGSRVNLSAEEEAAVRAEWAEFDVLYSERRMGVISDAVQKYMNTEAQNKGYDSIHTAVTYADEPASQTFQAEGRALRAWRSAVWESCYALLEQWKAGAIAEPTAEEVIAQLPKVVY